MAAQAAAAGKAAAAEAAERSAELQHALQDQLDAARRGLSEVPLLREQLQMAQQAVEHVDQLWEPLGGGAEKKWNAAACTARAARCCQASNGGEKDAIVQGMAGNRGRRIFSCRH